jgi:hypothetical protein
MFLVTRLFDPEIAAMANATPSAPPADPGLNQQS